MRLIALLLTGLLVAPPLAAQQREVSSAAPATSPERDAKATGKLPVSLGKIREGLEKPASSQLLKDELSKAAEKAPNFRLEIQEKQRIEELLATLDFKAGPTPVGGIYAYEQQRITTPPVDNPLAQPYAAFNQGQLATVIIENLVGKYFIARTSDALLKAYRERNEAAARKEITEAVSEYCAAKPNNGAGIEICAP